MSRDANQIAQDYSAMLGSVSVITNCLDDDNEFCNDMTSAEKKERVMRSSGYLSFMKDLDDWGSCLLYTSPSPRDGLLSRMPSSA